MARKIIIQERLDEPSDLNFRYVLRADVPTARQTYYADANATSVLKDASAQELQDLKDGKVRELQGKANYQAGTPTNQIKSDLIDKFNAFQAEVNLHNPFKFFGTSWDGTSWSLGGVN